MLQATTKIIVKGEAGIGKSVLLKQIKNNWLLPKFDSKHSQDYWLPISISLAGKGRYIEEKLLHYWAMTIKINNKDTFLPCRTILKNLNPTRSLKWLFDSPILLMDDGLDEVNSDFLIDFGEKLKDWLANNIIEGVICVKRENK